nr:uncharacterized protein LOC111427538 isoform X1 [Onthophagus taurus]
MFPTFISILDIQSWWEVPSIAHFCSLFRTAFNLLDFDIEDLEEALLTDGTEETSWLQELIVRLLSGCLPNNEISTFNYQMFLRRLFRQKCQEHDQYNPFNTDIDFQLLPLRTKVDILHALCDFRLDADDVLEALKNLEAGSLRVEPLGYDANRSAYWYFYGTRLYREDFKKNKNSKKDKSIWQVVCFTEDDWIQLTKKIKSSQSKAERLLYGTLTENFLPELPRLFREKERQARKRLLENLPRRTSSRIRKQEDEPAPLKEEEEEEEEENEPISKAEELEKQKLEEEIKRKISARKRKEAYERRSKLKEQSEDTQTDNSEEDTKSRDEMAGANARNKKAKGGRSRQQSESSTSSRDRGSIFSSSSNRSSSRTGGNQPSDMSISTGANKPVSTVGRQTNNSLACATGQIVIQPVSNPHRKKLKTSQVFRQSDEDLQTGMHKILDFVKNHDDAWPFVDPVDEEYAPNYYSVIRKPMDLQRMEERLDSGIYKSFSKFRDDFLLIVHNCHLYNGANNEYTEMVDNLQQVFERATERYLDEVTSDEEIAVEYPDMNKDSKGHKKKKISSMSPSKIKSTTTLKPPKKRSRSHSNNSSEEIEKDDVFEKTERKKEKLQEHEHIKKQSKKEKKDKIKRKSSDDEERVVKSKEKSLIKNSNKLEKKQKDTEKSLKDAKHKEGHIKSIEKQNKIKSDKHRSKDLKDTRDLKLARQIEKKPKLEDKKSKNPLKHDDKKKKNQKYKNKITSKFMSPSPERLKSRSPSLSPDRWSSSSPPPSWPPSSPDDYTFSPKRKDKSKASSDNENSNKLKAKHDKWKEVYKDKKEDLPKFSDRSQSPPKHIDKHNKLRETIEKLKAKSELAKMKEREKRELELKEKEFSLDVAENKIKSKSSDNKSKKKHEVEVDDGASTAESIQSEKKVDKNNAKNAAAIEALTLATEQTLKDINKWLDDTPKFEFSSASNSPSHFSSLDDFDMKVDDIKKKPEKVLTKKDSSKEIKKKPFRDPSKLFRRREVQRTIDRLQPGKSKGNLISNIQSTNKPDEIFPLGPLSKTLKDTKNSLIVKTDDSAPKLSLGSVLDSFGKHQFVDDAKKDDAPELKAEDVKENTESKENEVKPVTEKVEKEKVGNSPGKATPNLSAWFKAFGAPKVQPAQKKTDNKADGKENDNKSDDKENKNEEKKAVPLGDPSPTPDSPLMTYGQPTTRQRRISTGSSMSERSSFSQDMDSPRVGIDERLGAYPAPYPSPLHKSPSGASPIMVSPRPDMSPKTYPAFNGQMRVGFYQDTVSTKSSPDKSCSPRDNPQSPYPQYSEHIYTPPTQNSSYSYGNPSYYSHTPNYSSSNPTPPHNIEPNPSYFDTSKPLTDQYQKVLPNYSSPVNSQLPSPVSQQNSPAPPLSQQNSPGPVSPHISPTPDKITLEKQPVACPVKKRAFEGMQNDYNSQRQDVNVLVDSSNTSNSPVHSVSPVNEMTKYQNVAPETMQNDNIPSIDITESSDSNSSQRNTYNATSSPYNYNTEMNYGLTIPSTRSIESDRSIDMTKFTNMGYVEPDVGYQRSTYNPRNDVNYQRSTENIPQNNPPTNQNLSLRYNEPDLLNMGYKQMNPQNSQIGVQNMNRSNILQPVRSTADNTSRLSQPLDVTSGYKQTEMSIPRPNYNSSTIDIDQALGLRNLSNLTQIVDGRYPGEDRMLGLQSSGQTFYSDKNIAGSHMLGKPTISTTASTLPMFSQPNITIPYSTMQASNPIYSRQMAEMQTVNMMSQEKQATTVALQEKKTKKRKTPKTATPPSGISDGVSNPTSSTQNHQGFQSYAGLKNSSLEPSAISLKTTSVVPGSAFNFGPSPTSLGLGSTIYSDKDAFPTYLDEFRTAPNYYMAHAAAATHHRTTPDTAEKPVRTTHQPTPGQAPPTYPFIGAPQPRPPSYPLGGAFMSPHQAPLMDPSSQLYQQYFQSGMLHQGLLGAPSAYPAGYHPTLSMRQPYDAMNRPSWL